MRKKLSLFVTAVITASTLFSCQSETITQAPESSVSGTGITIPAVTTAAPTTAEPTTEPPTEPFSLDIWDTRGETPASDITDKIPSSHIIKGFETVMQEPELPTGCEVTALCEVLNYHGFDISKTDLFDNFMPVDHQGAVTMDYAYVGDPRANNGFGCYAPVCVKTAYEYFESIDSPCYAVDLTGTDFKDLLYQVYKDRPVIVWATIGMRECRPNYKWTAGNGEDFIFNDLQHCVAIYGYDLDKGIIYTGDPLVGNTEYPLEKFEKMYDIMYKQAVLICGDSKTEGSFRRDPEIENNKVWSRKKQLEEEAKKKEEQKN